MQKTWATEQIFGRRSIDNYLLYLQNWSQSLSVSVMLYDGLGFSPVEANLSGMLPLLWIKQNANEFSVLYHLEHIYLEKRPTQTREVTRMPFVYSYQERAVIEPREALIEAMARHFSGQQNASLLLEAIRKAIEEFPRLDTPALQNLVRIIRENN